jgi:type VI secretion system protein ImpD/type VI secretion system protein ImpC
MNDDTAPETPQALRDVVLSGRFFSRARAIQADAVADFLDPRAANALVTWFGTDMLARMRGDPAAIRGALDRDVAAIDALIGQQLDAVLHHPRQQRLEGAWRGLAWLVSGVEPGSKVKIRLLSVSWAELCRDLERAAEFDASQIFRKIYEEEFGTPGGEPFGLIVIDHEVRHRPAPGAATDDVGALASLAGVAAAAFSPMVLGASPALLELDTFADLSGVADPTSPLRDAAHQRFRGLGSMEDSRFIALALPRMLARRPWEDDPNRLDGFRYHEHAPDAAQRVWMSAGYAFAAVAVRAFADYGWPADVRGVEIDRTGGGLVTDLPLEAFTTDPGFTWVRHPLEIQLTDRQERAMVDAGLVPLTALPYGPDAVFCAVPSLQVPRQFQGATAAAADANARISSQISAMLCVARFAHCVKMMGRDMVGAFRTNDEIETKLQNWVTKYVNANLSAGSETRARFPLVAGRVSVRERPGKPGVFGCTILLQPHYQLDNVAATFRLMTDIAAPGRAA